MSAVPAASSLIKQDCPAFLYKNTTNMRYIPRGSFTMGGAYDTDEHRTPKWLAKTDDFYMDMHEVTIGDFLLFMEMTGYALAWTNSTTAIKTILKLIHMRELLTAVIRQMFDLCISGNSTHCLQRYLGMTLWRMPNGSANACQLK